MKTPRLIWQNKASPTKSEQVSLSLFERHQTISNPHFSSLFFGENKSILEHLLSQYKGKVKLIYLDPPFDSDANYHRNIRLRGEKTTYRLKKQQYHDQWERHEYLQFIYERLFLLKELLTEDGSIYLHADWHRIHHLRLLMDEVFGEENILNEIIWLHDFGGRSPHFLARKHDNLLLYRKGKSWTFNIDTLPDLPYQGNLHRYKTKNPKKGKKPTAVWHDIEVPSDFVWDIAYENKMSSHNTGYPTQKPIELLRRIIELSSNPDDVILDPFLGSGTTAVVAHRLGRNFIGIDANWDSIHTARTRLLHEDIAPNLTVQASSPRPIAPALLLNHKVLDNQLHLSVACSDIAALLGITANEWQDLDWRTWIQSISIDWSGATEELQNPMVDGPLSKKTLVQGHYEIPQNTSQITIEITDILCRTKRFIIDATDR